MWIKRVSGFAVPAMEHESELYYASEAGEKWKTADNNLYTGALQFASGAVGTLHLDGESIDEEQPALVIYGTEGILKPGDPNSFSGSVRLIPKNTPEMKIPFTHGYTGAPLYGPETPADYGQHRGVGAAEMAWSMICDRPHRASAELGLHTMELLCGLDKSSNEGAVYNMTTSLELPRALEPGHTDLILGGVRGGAEASLAK